MTDFASFGLSAPILAALAARKLTIPTPIQAQAIPSLMAGRDLLGLAQTGSGKTAAFALPLLEKLAREPAPVIKGSTRALVLAPTRELAAQCLEQINDFGRGLKIRTALAIGGASINRQKAETRRGLDVLVATPGRLVDLVSQDAIALRRVEYFVLDEVDQMLDLGFIHAIRKIASWLPAERQNVFFSATMVSNIEKLARGLLSNPVEVRIDSGPKPKIDERVVHMSSSDKPRRLIELAGSEGFESGLVFTRTKHGADRVVKTLAAAGLAAHAIHGNRSQPQRERALAAFKSRHARILVATDIAARGIDVTGVSHVVNYDLPNVPETYVHRIGRTGRAGASGIAVSFCAADERPFLKAIERLTGKRIPATGDAPANDDDAGEARGATGRPNGRGKPPQRQRRPGQSPDGHARSQPSEKSRDQSRAQNGANPGGNRAKPRADASSNSQSNDHTPRRADRPDQSRKPGDHKNAQTKKGPDDGERGAARVRRRRNRGPAGRKLQGAA